MSRQRSPARRGSASDEAAPARAYVRVRVVPRASRTALSREADGRLRAHLAAPPAEGAANRALIALLAERLGLPRHALEIAHGTRGRDKTVSVHGHAAADLGARIARAVPFAVDKGETRG